MKIIISSFLIFLTNTKLSAQQDYGIDDLGKLSVEQAEHLLENAEGEKIRMDMASEAIRSGKMDLIQMCFKNIESAEQFVKAAAQISNQDFRDQIVLMMLKIESSPFWRDDNGVGGVSSRNFLREPFIATIKRNFPNMPLNNDLVETRAAREKLARNLAVIIDRRNGTLPSPKAERPGKTLGSKSESMENHGNAHSIKPPSKDANVRASITAENTVIFRILSWSAALLTITGVLWLLLRKKKA